MRLGSQVGQLWQQMALGNALIKGQGLMDRSRQLRYERHKPRRSRASAVPQGGLQSPDVEDRLDRWYAVTLQGGLNSKVGRSSVEEMEQFPKAGHNKHAVVFAPLGEAFTTSCSRRLGARGRSVRA